MGSYVYFLYCYHDIQNKAIWHIKSIILVVIFRARPLWAAQPPAPLAHPGGRPPPPPSPQPPTPRARRRAWATAPGPFLVLYYPWGWGLEIREYFCLSFFTDLYVQTSLPASGPESFQTSQGCLWCFIKFLLSCRRKMWWQLSLYVMEEENTRHCIVPLMEWMSLNALHFFLPPTNFDHYTIEWVY